ncbi:DUF928 domain-containing protein [Gloeocapsopsis sp. IPPAS B-1203]|uniref:DUF928 domain-containing protein n=1 Tax=Gloeocapsopsis sp. IPPAS B-1203 TaxID=2049454 RepID=UPI000C1A23BC|nr:DUF928 domain-containing protein [Gloeocapsopsis sp. IPPAS B-1203]PIG92783.1 hypothetical protein CSQ79_14510 [Gloeocapsopsis sp. IPPAS B-1203]
MNFYWQCYKFALIGLAVIGVFPAKVYSVPKIKVEQQVIASATGQLNFTPPPPPVNIGIPGDRTGAGRRGCLVNNDSVDNKQLTALVPITKAATGLEVVWGLTTVEHPTFWFYVPYRAQDVHSARFVLRTADNQLVYQTSVSLPNKPGVISLTLPTTVALEVTNQYHWYFNIYCAERKPPTAIVHGGIQRRAITPTLASQLAQATPQQQTQLYFANGFWFDAVTTLGQLHYHNPSDMAIAKNWTDVLRFVGLDAIASEPIASCCDLMQQVRRD